MGPFFQKGHGLLRLRAPHFIIKKKVFISHFLHQELRGVPACVVPRPLATRQKIPDLNLYPCRDICSETDSKIKGKCRLFSSHVHSKPTLSIV